MTVKELINALQLLDEEDMNAEVKYSIGECLPDQLNEDSFFEKSLFVYEVEMMYIDGKLIAMLSGG